MKKIHAGLILSLALITSCKANFGSMAKPNDSIFAPSNLGLQQPEPLPLPTVLDNPADPNPSSDGFMIFSDKTSFHYSVSFIGIPVGGMVLKVVTYQALPKAIQSKVDIVTDVLFITKTRSMDMLVNAEEILAGGKTFMVQHPKVGDRWSSIKGEAEVIANESVNTPGHLFIGCWKVAYKLNGDTNYCWFAPNVGLVRMDFTETGKQFSAVVTQYSL
ncbi:MAG TPA: hypothetical protein DD435_05320 [Cyanobacteria bacterium UBA8530]|nr:hypothetical protein [Cyanobacteria bacterium UBA8530]